MCGRYSLAASGEDIANVFELDEIPSIEARYNVAPSQDVPVVRATGAEGARALTRLRWGLIPHWADDPLVGARTINARAESAALKPTYRDPFRERRCLVPADGFYEWKRLTDHKQPFRITLKGGKLFAFAGLWDSWQNPEGESIETFTIVTTEPNELLGSIHDRMPVILPPEHYRTWLDPSFDDIGRLQGLLGPYPAANMEAYPVGFGINVPEHDDPSLIEPLTHVWEQGRLAL